MPCFLIKTSISVPFPVDQLWALRHGYVTVVYLSVIIMHMASHCAAASRDAPVKTLLISVCASRTINTDVRLVSLNIVTPNTWSILSAGGVLRTQRCRSEIRGQTHQSNLSKCNLDITTHRTTFLREMWRLIYDYVNTFLEYVMECAVILAWKALERWWRKYPVATGNLL